jgi:hypothetical protein
VGAVRAVAEVPDPFAPLRLLAANLEEEIRDQGTHLSVSVHQNSLAVAYHQIVILNWRVAGRDLVCTPSGWRRKTYTALGPTQAREITIRLVFEFVRLFCSV